MTRTTREIGWILCRRRTLAAVVSTISFTLPAVDSTTAPSIPRGQESRPGSSTGPTFEQRVEAQRAIERVYWDHRIWPMENPTPKPRFEEAMLEETLRARVEDCLKKSNALEAWWKRPVTPEQLQAEMARMATETNAPSVLRELFAALGDDPTRIAETLVRQKLADRLVRNRYAHDERFHGEARRRAQEAVARARRVDDMRTSGGEYRETRWKRRVEGGLDTGLSDSGRRGQKAATIDMDAEEWLERRARLVRLFGAEPEALPLNRWSGLVETEDAYTVTAVLAAAENEITVATTTWRKTPFDAWWSVERAKHGTILEERAATYESVEILAEPCTDDSWRKTLDRDVPDPRTFSTTVWTGTEMIVWGGFGGSYLNTGGRYDPATDTWRPTSTAAGVPSGRYAHTAVWTGTTMIVWGGDAGYGMNTLNTGGGYDPAADAWLPTSTGANLPSARYFHTAVWTGTRMVVWGGGTTGADVATGGRYDPTADAWLPTSLGPNLPSPRHGHAAVWTGEKMIVWGGASVPGVTYLDSGGLYDPTADTWLPTSIGANVPSPRFAPAVVWTGEKMIVWSGYDGTYLNTGGRYDPATDSWAPTSTGANVPSPRYYATGVWTGTKMIVWGGYGGGGTYPNSGGRYDPTTDTWAATSTGVGVPTGRYLHTAVWTGTEMIVWGGEAIARFNTGGRYDPVTDTWAPTSTGAGVPAARFLHAAVWTGTEMIIWGGYDGRVLDTGSRYDPATDTWSPTPMTGFQSARDAHSAVWTGTEMIVWGGYNVAELNTGGRYNPTLEVWTATSTGANVPSPRYYHTAVWTGGVMLVWGGTDDVQTRNTGGRYAPPTDSWLPTSTGTNVPAARWAHAAIWTGNQMIVWGGADFDETTAFDTGGRYDAATDTWLPTSTGAGVPSGRYWHTATWTGSRMIVWGGRDAVDTSLNTGSRYDPSADTWAAMSTGAGVPSPRRGHAAVSTGTEMIVWGGKGALNPSFDTGGRYDSATDTWGATSTGAGLPSARAFFTAVWTGAKMIVWGGEPSKATGGAYCSAALCSTSPECDDANSCTTDSCDPSTSRCVNAPGGPTEAWFADVDEDRYGDPATSIEACYPPPNHVRNALDCDDTDRSVLPGGIEACDDKRNDCDGAGWPALLDDDSDGIENACETCTDSDGDGWGDPGAPGNLCAPDNCPTTPNPGQEDEDFDGRGNACDPCPKDPLDDGDGDGLCGEQDNCPFDPNPIQQNTDGDPYGDACDPCPLVPGTVCDPDNDGDGIPNASDPDDDNDGIPDEDGDGLPDPCTGGNRLNCDDNCPFDFNVSQRDRDGDGIGDTCDPSDDLVQGGTASKEVGGGPGLLAGAVTYTFAWEPENGALGYNVYRGLLSVLAAGSYGSCYRNRIVTRYTILPEDPGSGTGFFYLATPVYAEREGSLGDRSDGSERALASACP